MNRKRNFPLKICILVLFSALCIFQANFSSKTTIGEEIKDHAYFPIAQSEANYTYENFTPSLIQTNIFNGSVQLETFGPGPMSGTERFAYSLQGEPPKYWISAHDDNFSDNIIGKFWETVNSGSGWFVENSTGLNLIDNGQHAWSWDIMNGTRMDAPAMFQDIYGDFKIQTRLNYSRFSSFQEKAGILISWSGGFLTCGTGLDGTLTKINSVIHIYSNNSYRLLNSTIFGPEMEYDLGLSRKGDKFSVTFSNDGFNYSLFHAHSLNLPNDLKVGLYVGNGGEIIVKEWKISPSISYQENSTNKGNLTVLNIPFDYTHTENNSIQFLMNDTINQALLSSVHNVSIDCSSGDINMPLFSPTNTTSLQMDISCFTGLFFGSWDYLHRYTEAFAYTIDGSKPENFISPHVDLFNDVYLREFWEPNNPSCINTSFNGSHLLLKDLNNSSVNQTSNLPSITQLIQGDFKSIFKLEYSTLANSSEVGFILQENPNHTYLFYLKKNGSLANFTILEIGINDTYLSSLSKIINITSSELWLRLVRENDTIKFSYSTNGDTYALYEEINEIILSSTGVLKIGMFAARNTTACIDYWHITPSIQVIYAFGFPILRVNAFKLDPTGTNLFRFQVNSTSNITSQSNVFYMEILEKFQNDVEFLISDGNEVEKVDWGGNVLWNLPLSKVLDKEVLPNGNFLITRGAPGFGEIIEVDETGNVLMNFSSLGGQNLNWPHDTDFLPNGNYLVADTANDRVVEFDHLGDVVWDWHLSDTLDPANFNGTIAYVNDVDRLDNGNSLISLRNYNMVMEIDANGILIWSYGEFSNSTILNHPHNPDRLNNGNTIICDSENRRILEVTSDGSVVWNYAPQVGNDSMLGWPRDADLINDDTVLISDSWNAGQGKNRIYLINKTTEGIIWMFDTTDANYDSDAIITSIPEAKIYSPLNTTYRRSRSVDIFIKEDANFVNAMYNIYDNTTCNWLFYSNKSYSGQERLILEDGHQYTLHAWSNLTTGGGGWPQDDSLLMKQLSPSRIDFKINLSDPVPTNESYEGTTLVSLSRIPQIIEITRDNKIIWQYFYTPPSSIEATEVLMGDFERLANGNILYSVAIRLGGGDDGIFIFDEIDRDGNIVWTHEFEINGTPLGDYHDIDYLPETDTILFASTPDDAVYEIDRNGTIIWSWLAADHFTRNTSGEWTHMNGVQRLPNGNTLISPRNFDIVIEVDSSGDILWQYGNLSLNDPLQDQHHPVRLPNGNTIICDSMHDRVIEVNLTGDIVWTTDDYFSNPEEDMDWPRSLNPLPNGNLIICLPTQGLQKVIEIDRAGNVLWEYFNDIWIFSVERVDNHAPIPTKYFQDDESRFNECVQIQLEALEPDLDSIWYNVYDFSNLNYTFHQNMTYTQIVNHALPWGNYALHAWTNDTGLINIYQGHVAKPNIGGVFCKNFTISPILHETEQYGGFGGVVINWDGVLDADYYNIYYSLGEITILNEDVILAGNSTGASFEFQFPRKGDYYIAVVAVNGSLTSPFSNNIIITFYGTANNNTWVIVIIFSALIAGFFSLLTVLMKRKRKSISKIYAELTLDMGDNESDTSDEKLEF